MITEFGKRLRKARIDLGVNLGQMAKDVGVSPAFLSSIETGKRKIGLEVLRKLSEQLSLTGQEAIDFEVLAFESNKEMKLSLEGRRRSEVETITMLARKMSDLDEDKLEELRNLVAQETMVES